MCGTPSYAVYLGTYDGEECAVKVLHPQVSDNNPAQARMLLREGKLLMDEQLSHNQ